MKITNIFFITIFLFVFLILLFSLFLYSKRIKRSEKNKIAIPLHKPFLKEQEFNPDINKDNWALHKIRLEKFRRSQYKGLTFLISQNRIYYLSEKGDKVYC